MMANDLLDYRDRYPNAPGFQRTDTSRAAADAIAPDLNDLQALVLAAIEGEGEQGMTTNECARFLSMSKDTVQPRTSELRALGLIKDSGRRRPNDSGRKAIVWVAP